MIAKTLLLFAAAFGLSPAARGQQAGDGPIQLRAVLHDPAHPVADLFILDQSGNRVKLDLQIGGLSNPQTTRPVAGKVLFFTTGSTDPKSPQADLAASISVPPILKNAIFILVPAPGKNPPFRAVLIDDSAQSFSKGESCVLNLVPMETAIEVGEHKLQVLPGKVTRVPVVKKVTEFNMAQTNFHFKEGGSWVTFTERKVQYLNDFRRIFIVSATPGASQPFVTTILDTAPATAPANP
jgi:hypothetical protein